LHPRAELSSLARTTIEIHRRMSALSLTFMVISRNLVGNLPIKASEILTEIDPKFNIHYASTI
jgi:hypothetical protein